LAGRSVIAELAASGGLRGTQSHKFAEPSTVKTLPVIDNAAPVGKNIRTSVDCYVAGQYVNKKGNVIEVTQRYTIFVAYNKQTQMMTMQQVRERILSDFQAKYGATFNISNVFIPQLPIPVGERVSRQTKAAPVQLYRGTDSFKSMTQRERMIFEVGTQREVADTNIKSIRSRYGYKR
jgi:hypothetical protein